MENKKIAKNKCSLVKTHKGKKYIKTPEILLKT